MVQLRRLTHLVEPLSIDEAFLDVSDLSDEVEEIAANLQAIINLELKLPCSLGVASNKLVAKIANDVGKSQIQTGDYPNTITIVPPGQEAAFLAPLPARALWGVGPKMEQRLAKIGIQSIGEIANWPEEELVQHIGNMGRELSRRAKGIDHRPVTTEHDVKSVSKEMTFTQDINVQRELLRALRRLSEDVGRNLRRKEMFGSTVKIKLRWPDFTTITRQSTLPRPTNHDDEIFATARDLFYREWHTGKAVRLLGVGVSGLSEGYRQMSLWDAADENNNQSLQETLDKLRQRYGRKVVRRGI
jgi:nucleotidyltransferase/DNA polymerase involved in DNA repair